MCCRGDAPQRGFFSRGPIASQQFFRDRAKEFLEENLMIGPNHGWLPTAKEAHARLRRDGTIKGDTITFTVEQFNGAFFNRMDVDGVTAEASRQTCFSKISGEMEGDEGEHEVDENFEVSSGGIPGTEH